MQFPPALFQRTAQEEVCGVLLGTVRCGVSHGKPVIQNLVVKRTVFVPAENGPVCAGTEHHAPRSFVH